MKRMSWATAAAIVAVSGCVSTGTQVDQASLAKFQTGITTETQVEATLGPPEATTAASDGTRTITYIYASARAKGVDFIPIVGLFAGGAAGESTAVVFRFAADGKLLSYSASSQKTDVHSGF